MIERKEGRKVGQLDIDIGRLRRRKRREIRRRKQK